MYTTQQLFIDVGIQKYDENWKARMGCYKSGCWITVSPKAAS
jgi:hypothetical protein